MARPPNADPEATRERVLFAARTIAVREGLKAVTAEAISKEAGTAKSTVGDMARVIEHLIDYVFAACVAAHGRAVGGIGENRWRAYQVSVDLFDEEPDLCALVLIACALAVPTAGTGMAVDHARHFRQVHSNARTVLAADAAHVGTAQNDMLDYANEVITDFIEIAAQTWARRICGDEG